MKRLIEIWATLIAFGLPMTAQSVGTQPKHQGVATLAYAAPQDQDDQRRRDDDKRRQDRDWDQDRDRAWHRNHQQGGDWDDARDRAWHREHDRDRDNGYRDRAGQWRGRLSAQDQSRFDRYYSRWQQYRATNNGDQVSSMEKRMRNLYAHYGIPNDVPFGDIASSGRR